MVEAIIKAEEAQLKLIKRIMTPKKKCVIVVNNNFMTLVISHPSVTPCLVPRHKHKYYTVL